MSDRILIVDDAEDVWRTLFGLLEDKGYRVAGSGSAGEARSALAREAQDCSTSSCLRTASSCSPSRSSDIDRTDPR